MGDLPEDDGLEAAIQELGEAVRTRNAAFDQRKAAMSAYDAALDGETLARQKVLLLVEKRVDPNWR